MRFQFPTGWNSTLNSTILSERSKCFNSQRDGILLWIGIAWGIAIGSSFNSQRDGILHSSCVAQYDGRQLVSIPNGMEFYVDTFSSCCVRSCFNSQRDGILRFKCAGLRYKIREFQFPTGWNSTHSRKEAQDRKGKFQFPTGWNSTIQG